MKTLLLSVLVIWMTCWQVMGVRVGVYSLDDSNNNKTLSRILLQTGAETLFGAEFIINHDADLGVSSVKSSDSVFVSNTSVPGQIKLAIANATGITGDKILVEVKFDKIISDSVISVSNVSLNEGGLTSLGAVDTGVFDRDGDGVLDFDEEEIFNTDSDLKDTDGDGYGDRFEIENSANPNDATSFPIRDPVITLVGEAELVLEAALDGTYTDPGATCQDEVDGDLAASVVVAGDPVDLKVPGSYVVTYNCQDAAGNPAVQVTRTVTVVDTTAPVITLLGSATETVEAGFPYTDAGAAAHDTFDGDITGNIVTVNPVDVNTAGTYTVTYDVSDAADNNAVKVIRTVTVVDTTLPVITVISGVDTVEPGGSWTDAGATTTEGTISTSGTVNTNTLGTYTITYTATDASSNTGTATRTVTVVVSVGVETQTLNLKAGWNLVSFYVEADDMTPATVFAPIQDKLLLVKSLTELYDPSLSVLNTLSSLSVKDGYWVKVSENVSLDVEGAVPSGASINVNTGWNLVGYPRSSGEGVVDELTSLGNTVVHIKDLGSSYDWSLPSFLNTLSTMAPGSGYWLNVDADGTWTVGTLVEVSELRRSIAQTRSDHSPEEKVSQPWGEAIVYPNLGATVLAKVSIQGKPVAKGGVVGVFVGNELRGIQDVVLHDGISYVTLNVNLNGAEAVSYRVWNPDDHNEYLVSGTMLLELGSMYGKPELMDLDAVTVVDKPLEVFKLTSEPFGFSFNTAVGRSYTVEATGDLQRWKAVELFQGSGGEIRFTAKPISSGGAQFFRVLVE
jgi:hypothetical protein